jgi:hypothetical protein
VRRIFAPGQLERARMLKMLLRKGVPLAHLAGTDLAVEGQAYRRTSSTTATSCEHAGMLRRRSPRCKKKSALLLAWQGRARKRYTWREYHSQTFCRLSFARRSAWRHAPE